MKCLNCGNEVMGKFCSKCGKPVQQQSQTPQQPQNRQFNYQQAQQFTKTPLQPSPAPIPKKKSNKELIITICILSCIAVAMIVWLLAILFMNPVNDNYREEETTISEQIEEDSDEEASENDKKENKKKKIKDDEEENEEDSEVEKEEEETEENKIEEEEIKGLNYSNNSYLYPTDKKYITTEDLSGLTKEEVALLRNELYARHGYTFSTASYKEFFSQKSWYRPNPSLTDGAAVEKYFNQYELANKQFLVQYEKDMGWR